ncbi:hypothetical protein G6F57_002706 [Rhizopus arrhizus]|uniref:Uncharacterized protein n=1 Tax=Rhizopus oryzae TaxID=64495 RepID=A0A9P7BVP6_RHIOR|nr:hypothetical protein G6F23_003341 [Rhizopus arrhizus]KAG1411845.1 hypothetical protein G6F58_008344 [Rhizopus delemar]KAG0769704.1 hypothetical protein G6F24_000840 [Rhizopus arrhizus]KAG0786134.1 hypothetical protein G6F22_007721 [Rhizopus arrhizus]KAG0796461.1 hypothetical protein G6F21_001288 [Rhizopus arrhizus]
MEDFNAWDPQKDTILIVTKARDNKLVSFTIQLAEWLIFTPRFGQKYPFKVYVDGHLKNTERVRHLVHPAWQSRLKFWNPKLCHRQSNSFHLIITSHVPPIMPFHLGSLGFLAPFLFTSYRTELTNLFEGRLKNKAHRMRLSCTVYRFRPSPSSSTKRLQTADGTIKQQNNDRLVLTETAWVQRAYGRGLKGDRCQVDYSVVPAQTFQVLNEIVVDRGTSSNMSFLELFADDRHLTTVQADGLCIATATGSTAYSLSANGSLVHPDMMCTLVTPLCPHTLSFRPMLLPSTITIRIIVPFESRHTVHCRFDGRNTVEMNQGDHVKITMSPYPVYTYSASDASNDWFSSVQTCLHWNIREPQKALENVDQKKNSALFKHTHDNKFSSEDEEDVGLVPWTEYELERDYTLGINHHKTISKL